MTNLTKKCVVCGKEFSKGKNVSLKTWNTTTKYCSKDCQKSEVGKIASLRLTQLNKSRTGTPLSDEAKKKKSKSLKRKWYLKNRDRLSIENRKKYQDESLEKKERRKILLEARDTIPGVREKRLLYYKTYRELHTEQCKNYSKRDVYRYKSYKSSAKKRKYDFTLTFEEFKEIFHKDCSYCGMIDARGIDRKDNTIGYTINNSVPCCEMCNKMKWRWTEEQFKGQVEKIYNNLFNK